MNIDLNTFGMTLWHLTVGNALVCKVVHAAIALVTGVISEHARILEINSIYIKLPLGKEKFMCFFIFFYF